MQPKPLRHKLFVEPIYDRQWQGWNGPLPLYLPEHHVDKNSSYGWVRAVGELDEDIQVGDLVVFVSWKQRIAHLDPTEYYKERLYVLHEDDIELIVTDW